MTMMHYFLKNHRYDDDERSILSLNLFTSTRLQLQLTFCQKCHSRPAEDHFNFHIIHKTHVKIDYNYNMSHRVQASMSYKLNFSKTPLRFSIVNCNANESTISFLFHPYAYASYFYVYVLLLSVQRNDTKHVFQICLKKKWLLYFSCLIASFLGSHAKLLVPGTVGVGSFLHSIRQIVPPLGYVGLDCDSSLHLKRLHLYDMRFPVVLSQAGGTTVFMDHIDIEYRQEKKWLKELLRKQIHQ